jgi:hypothetical protein
LLAAALLSASAPLAAQAQTFLRCDVVYSGSTRTSEVYAFDQDSIYRLGVGDRLIDQCEVATHYDPEAESGHQVDDVRCTVNAQVIRFETTSAVGRSLAASGRGEPWFIDIEIYRANGDMRAMVGHSFEGSGACERIDDPRRAAPAF